MPIYEMTVTKDGPRFRPMREGEQSSPHGAPGHLPSRDLAGLAAVLSTFSDRLVIDKTGLTGSYNLDVDISSARQDAGWREDPYAVVFRETARQLGLRFIATKAAVEAMVVDRAEKPSGN